MDAMSVFEFLRVNMVAILASLGGAVPIVFGLTAWAGRIWAARILSKDKQNYAEALEQMKNALAIERGRQEKASALILEVASKKLVGYSEHQFHTYLNLWNMLCELKSSASGLHNKNSADMITFSEQLATARSELFKVSLLVDKATCDSISDILYRLLLLMGTASEVAGIITDKKFDLIDSESFEKKRGKLIGEWVNSENTYLSKVSNLRDALRVQLGMAPDFGAGS